MTRPHERETPKSPEKRADAKLPIAPEKLRRVAPDVIDQRQQQIDPAGRHRIDPDDPTEKNMKQPGRLRR